MEENNTTAQLHSIRDGYHERCTRLGRERDRLSRQSSTVSHLRLLSFLVGAFGLGWGLWNLDQLKILQIVVGGLGLLVFIVLIFIHDRLLRRLQRAEELWRINDEALARLDRHWEKLPLPRHEIDEPIPPRAGDLDLLGRASLFHLLGTAATPPGKKTLLHWLLNPATPDDIRQRQAAVAELAPLLDWRQELYVRGRLMTDQPLDLEPFLSWAEGKAWLLPQKVLLWLPRLLALANIASILLLVFEVIHRPYWLLISVLNLLGSAYLGKKAHVIYGHVSRKEREFHQYAELFRLFSAEKFTSAKLSALQEHLTASEHSASREMQRLDRIMSLADIRYSSLIYLPLQALLLWDAHVLYLLERWQQRTGREIRRWFSLLGEAEALCALAGLKHDHPWWAFPQLAEESEPVITASALGHPLLHPEHCVPNDVTLGPPQTFLLVTGSNMSGKSTLLRALGTNVILALAGGPVCARDMRLFPVELGTSFRIRDSLEEGVSYFMAELRRLKEIVDLAARCQQRQPAIPLLYLLDEILLGTNIVERQIAVQRVLHHLLQRGAMGAISTHDLTLASAPGLGEACRPVHFLESFHEDQGGPSMTFDYQLRQGIAPTVNALKLLHMVGLDEEERRPPP